MKVDLELITANTYDTLDSNDNIIQFQLQAYQSKQAAQRWQKQHIHNNCLTLQLWTICKIILSSQDEVAILQRSSLMIKS